MGLPGPEKGKDRKVEDLTILVIHFNGGVLLEKAPRPRAPGGPDRVPEPARSSAAGGSPRLRGRPGLPCSPDPRFAGGKAHLHLLAASGT